MTCSRISLVLFKVKLVKNAKTLEKQLLYFTKDSNMSNKICADLLVFVKIKKCKMNYFEPNPSSYELNVIITIPVVLGKMLIHIIRVSNLLQARSTNPV